MMHMKRMLAMLLTVLMLAGLFPVSAFAEEESVSGGGYDFSGYGPLETAKVTILYIDQYSGQPTRTEVTVEKGASYTLIAGPTEAKNNGNDPTVFLGWSTDDGDSKKCISSVPQLESLLAKGCFCKAGTTAGPAEADVTYYAVWGRRSVTEVAEITLTSGDGSWSYDGAAHSNRSYTASLNNGSAVAAAETDAGYVAVLPNGYEVTFIPAASAEVTDITESAVANSFTVQVKDAAGNTLAAGTDFIARYRVGTLQVTEPDEVTITYIAGEGGKVAVASGEASVTGTETLDRTEGSAQGAVPVAEDGYRFDGWYTDESFSTAASAALVDSTGRITPAKADGSYSTAVYYAKFRQGIRLVYDLNGGRADINPVDELYDSAEESITVSDAAPVRAGYNFRGWSTNSGAKTADYVGGDSVALSQLLSEADAKVATLYAVWTRCSYNFNAELGYYEDGSWNCIRTVSLPTGQVSAKAPVLDGDYAKYVFNRGECVAADGSTVNVDYINAAGSENGVTYYHSLASEVIGTEVREGEVIRLVYQLQSISYPVSYQLYIKNYGETEYRLCEDNEFSSQIFTGPSVIGQGEDLAFTVSMPSGYQYDSTGGFYLARSGSGIPKITKIFTYQDSGAVRSFTLSSALIEQNVTNGNDGEEIYVVVYLIEQNCTLSWSGSNTLMVANGKESHAQQAGAAVFENILGKTTTSFVLYPYHNKPGPNGAGTSNNASDKELNLVNITINGVTVSLNLENGASTVLPDGSVATISVVANDRFDAAIEASGKISDYVSNGDAHRVTITNPNGFHSSITVYSNHKNALAYEFWLISLNGIEMPTQKNAVGSNDAAPSTLILPGTTKYLGVSKAGITCTLYFNVLDGYSTDVGDITATMLVNKTETRTLTVSELAPGSNGYNAGYRYCVHFTSISGEKDNRISLSSKKASYVVSYDLAGGSPADYADPASYARDGIISAGNRLSIPTREGYVFKGWELLDADGAVVKTLRHGDSISVSDNLEYFIHKSGANAVYELKLRAKWVASGEQEEYEIQITAKLPDGTVVHVFTEPSYKVDHVIVGAEAVHQKVLTKGSNLPENFEKIYELKGDAIFSWAELEKSNFRIEMVYSYREYTVTYKYNNGSSNGERVFSSLHYGDQTPTVTDPSKTGAVFSGWKGVINSNGITFTGVKDTVTGNTVYTAQWGYRLTIHYKYKATGAKAFDDYVGVYPAGGIYNVYETAKTITGYNRSVNGVAGYMPERSVETTVYYTPIQYTISFVNEDGSNISSEKYPYGTAASAIVRPNSPTKVGYSFAGWTPTITKVTGNATYTASFTVDPAQQHTASYTIEFYVDGVLQKKDTLTGSVTKQVLETATVTVDYTADANKYTGYKPDTAKSDVVPASVSATGTGNAEAVYKIYYVKDDTQQHTASYTIEFYVDGVLQQKDTLTGSVTKQVLETAMVTVNYTADANKYIGYKPDTAKSDAVPASVSTTGTGNAEAVYKIYYVKDATQQHTASYTIQFYVAGELQSADTLTGSESAYVLDTASVTVDYTADANKYTGYKLDPTNSDAVPTSLSTTGTGDTAETYKIYYVVDTVGAITVTADSASKVYDGNPLTASTCTLSSGSLRKGDRIVATVSGSVTEVAASVAGNNRITEFKIMRGETDVTFCYTVTLLRGTLTVEPREITITPNAVEAVYDAEKHGAADAKGYTTTGLENTGFVLEGVQVVGDQVDAGSYAAALSIDVTGITMKNGTKTVAAGNYRLVPGTATITITPCPVTVSVKGTQQTAPYSGEEQSVSGFEVKADNELFDPEEDLVFTGGIMLLEETGENTGNDAYAAGVDAGSYPMGLSEDSFVCTNDNFNMSLQLTDGVLTIEPKAVTLTSAGGSKTYDGTALTMPNVTGTQDFIAGQVGVVKATGTVTDVADGVVTNSIQITELEGFKSQNYSITLNEGQLQILPVETEVVVTITGATATELYSGTEAAAEGYTTEISNALYTEADFSFKGSDRAAGTNAGSYPMNLQTADFENTSPNFANVRFVLAEDGMLTVTKRNVILQSGNATRAYNGTALVNHSFTVGGDGFVGSDTVNCHYTGSQTQVGSSRNLFTYTFAGSSADNYEILLTYGTLTISPEMFTLTVRYLDEAGNEVFADYVGQFAAGSTYYVVSPAKDGFTPDYSFVGSSAEGMPAHDVTVTVVYKADGEAPKGGEIIDYTLTPVEPDAIPLAPGGEHVDDVLYFLLTAAAFVVELVYFGRRKKYLAQIAELKQQLGDAE